MLPVQVAPPSLLPFRNSRAYPRLQVEKSAERGEKEGPQSSLLLLPFMLGLQNVHLSVKNVGRGTAKGISVQRSQRGARLRL